MTYTRNVLHLAHVDSLNVQVILKTGNLVVNADRHQNGLVTVITFILRSLQLYPAYKNIRKEILTRPSHRQLSEVYLTMLV